MWVVMGDEWCERVLKRSMYIKAFSERELARRREMMRQRDISHRITAFFSECSAEVYHAEGGQTAAP